MERSESPHIPWSTDELEAVGLPTLKFIPAEELAKLGFFRRIHVKVLSWLALKALAYLTNRPIKRKTRELQIANLRKLEESCSPLSHKVLLAYILALGISLGAAVLMNVFSQPPAEPVSTRVI